MKFLLEIELDNEAMQSRADIRWAIQRQLFRKWEDEGEVHIAINGAAYGTIRDDNGNTVGKWSVTH